MEILTTTELQSRFDEILERVKKGENFGIIEDDTGKVVVMMPMDEELLKLYTDHNEAN
jgi:antitoxin (DNA-binding transcriptional repressor) of toxin-antitoxin stability system